MCPDLQAVRGCTWDLAPTAACSHLWHCLASRVAAHPTALHAPTPCRSSPCPLQVHALKAQRAALQHELAPLSARMLAREVGRRRAVGDAGRPTQV